MTSQHRTPRVLAALGVACLAALVLAPTAQALPDERPARDHANDRSMNVPNGVAAGHGRLGILHALAGLGIRVGIAGENDTIDPVAGAKITLLRPGHDEPVRTGETNEDGRTWFLLRRGALIVEIEAGDVNASYDLVLHKWTRLDVYIDAEGVVHFFEHERDRIPPAHRPRLLVVRVGQEDENGTKAPIAGATVTITKLDGDATNGSRSKETGERGLAGFLLPRGRYQVDVEAGDLAAQAIVEMDERAEGLCVLFTADGTPLVNEECRWKRFRSAEPTEDAVEDEPDA